MKGMGLTIFLMLLSYQASWAITIFEFKTQDAGEAATQPMTVSADVENRRLKLDTDARSTLIYRGDLPEKVVFILDHDEKTAQSMDRKQMQAVSSQMQQMMQQMQAQMKNLPPEMQKRFANMQMNKPPQPAQTDMGPKPKITKTNKRDTVANIPCVIYEMRAQDDVTEVCAAPWNKVKNGRATLELLQEMMAFQRDMMQSMMSGMPQMGKRRQEIDHAMMMGIDIQQGFPCASNSLSRAT